MRRENRQKTVNYNDYCIKCVTRLFVLKMTFCFLNVTSKTSLLEEVLLFGGFFGRDFCSFHESAKAVHSVIVPRI